MGGILSLAYLLFFILQSIFLWGPGGCIFKVVYFLKIFPKLIYITWKLGRGVPSSYLDLELKEFFFITEIAMYRIKNSFTENFEQNSWYHKKVLSDILLTFLYI